MWSVLFVLFVVSLIQYYCPPEKRPKKISIVRKMIANGKLPHVQDEEGGPFMLDIRDLDAWVEKLKTTKSA